MKLIALDSSGLVASCAIISDGILLAEYTTDYKKTHSQTLLPMLDEIARMTNFDPKEADAIAVAAGPGSFTGLRIGAATAKGLGLALGKPIVEVPTLMGLAYNLYDSPGLICPMMDARRAQVYNGLYRFRDHAITVEADQRALSVEDLTAELNQRGEAVTFLGDGVDVYRDLLETFLTIPHTYAPVHLARQRASSVGALGEKLYEMGRAVPAGEHVPVYLRKSQAEREREAGGKAGT